MPLILHEYSDAVGQLELYAPVQVYEEGRMSKHMDELEIGDKLLFKGPRGRFKYPCNAKRSLGMHPYRLQPVVVCLGLLVQTVWFLAFHLSGVLLHCTARMAVGSRTVSAGMIAGGTGITPMYQVATQLLKDPQDHTKAWVFSLISHGWGSACAFVITNSDRGSSAHCADEGLVCFVADELDLWQCQS